jgi:Ca-activated chloride channel family protein
MKRVIVWLALTAALAASWAGGAPSEPVTEMGTVTGIVVDSTAQRPLAYVNVILVGTSYGAMTGADGRYRIERVPAGTYTVKAMMMGYKALERKDVEVTAGAEVRADFKLDVTIVSKTQEIVATAEKPMVEVTESKAAVTVTSEQIEELPVDEILEGVALKGGIVKSGDEMHIRGGRRGNPQAQIDGCAVTRQSARCSTPPRRVESFRMQRQPSNTESYDAVRENIFHEALENPFSTFSIDVDAASYANVRRFLRRGQLPPPAAVRIEEMINYFTYDYPDPEGEDPFSITTEVARCPWSAEHHLVHIGLQGKRVAMSDLPPSNIVFLLDVSGSMRPSNKLPLLKKAFAMLVDNLRDDDRVAIVVYAGSAGLVLPSTRGSDKVTILDAIERLHARGSTAGGEGIKLAYKVARENFMEKGNNRVILATDGDFNVGVSSDGEMVQLIEEERKSGVFLTVLGFGEGNLKDSKMEKLADHGNGQYVYIDDVHEARRVLVEQLGGSLFTIAKDVKIQVEFNPARVHSYRLIGYENRLLRREDFDDDTKDAGEIGAGHSVTALYEIVPVSPTGEVAETGGPASENRYTTVSVRPEALATDEILAVRFRYKRPDEDESRLIERTLSAHDVAFAEASDDLRFSAAVAELGMILRESGFAGEGTFDQVLEIAKGATGRDPGGYRAEFVRLVEMSQGIAQR